MYLLLLQGLSDLPPSSISDWYSKLLLFCTVLYLGYCLQASRNRLAAAVQQSMQHNVHHWEVAQVCDWAEYIGLGQYRKKFVHHCIDGRLLLNLTHKDLKVPHTHCPLACLALQHVLWTIL